MNKDQLIEKPEINIVGVIANHQFNWYICSNEMWTMDIDKNGQLLTSDIQTQIDWYTANNMLSGKLQASDIANTSFQEAATK